MKSKLPYFLAAISLLTISASAQSPPPPPAGPPRNVVPVSFDPKTGDITIGATTYAGQNPGFHIVAIDREPSRSTPQQPKVIFSNNYFGYNDHTRIISDLEALLQSNPNAMIMANAVGGYGFYLWTVGFEFVKFGSTIEVGAINEVPFAFVGIGGQSPGTAALERWSSTRGVKGYLAADSSGNYAFIQTDFVRYDISTNGDISVAGKTYTVKDSFMVGCDGNDVFHFVIVDREDPTISYGNNSYCTSKSDVEIQRLWGDINTLTGNVTDESRLVLIGTSGNPIPKNWSFGATGDKRFAPLAQAVRKLGGYWETVSYLSPADTFALIGAAPPPVGTSNASRRAREASSVYPAMKIGQPTTGQLHGVLSRSGRGNWYSPLNASVFSPTDDGAPNFGLYDILATPTYTPYPTWTDAPSIAAFNRLGQLYCGSPCNIREKYLDLNTPAENIGNALSTALDQNGVACGNPNADPTFCAVRAKLLDEVKKIGVIQSLYKNMNQLWLATGEIGISSQLGAFNTVKETLPVIPTAPSQSLVGPLVNLFLGLGGMIPEVGPLFGLADIAFNFGTSLTADEAGQKTIDLKPTFAQMQDDTIKSFIAQGSTTSTLFSLMIQDYGMTQALGQALTGAGTDSPWYWNQGDETKILQVLAPAISQAAYQVLMPGAYAIGKYVPWTQGCAGYWNTLPVANQPCGYAVIDGRPSPGIATARPFNLPNYVPYTYPSDTSNPYQKDYRTATIISDSAWLGISALNTPVVQPNDGYLYSPPDSTLLTKLFKPVSEGGLGVYRPAFFNDWAFPQITCNNSFDGGGDVGGCFWTAAAPSPSMSVGGAPRNKVTVRATQTKTPPTRFEPIDVTVTLHNSGTRTANLLSIDSITLGAAGGFGQLSLDTQSLPIQITNLKPGESTSVKLKVLAFSGQSNMTMTVKGLIINGSTAAATPTRFSETAPLNLR